MFYIGDGETGPTDAYTCTGFVVWDDSMPPTMTVGNVVMVMVWKEVHL